MLVSLTRNSVARLAHSYEFEQLNPSSHDVVLSALHTAAGDVQTYDAFLLTHTTSERSLCHHLAAYLSQRLVNQGADMHVDCEYNRIDAPGVDDRVKRLLIAECGLNAQREVLPDIIVHSRGNNDHNALVVEAKVLSQARTDAIKFDFCKLNTFIADSDFRYRTAAFVLFTDGPTPAIDIYVRAAPELP